jgi:hypothetical protein
MSKSNCTKVHPGKDPGPRSVPKCGNGIFDPIGLSKGWNWIKKNICYLHYLCMLSLHLMPHQVHLLYISKMKFNALSHLLQIHVAISISNLIILPVNIIWQKCTYLFEGSNIPLPHLGTLRGPGSLKPI